MDATHHPLQTPSDNATPEPAPGGAGDAGADHQQPRNEAQQAPAPAPSAANPAPASPAPAPRRGDADQLVSDEVQAEIDAAMAHLGMGGKGSAGGSGPAPGEKGAGGEGHRPAIRGPRVVQAGREHRTGTVVSIGPTDIFLEFGPKELGVAPRQQWPDEELPAVGSQFEVVVDRFEPGESLYICSRPGAVQKADWELLEVGQTVEARVTGTNKGGLELEIAGHRAFMPASQASLDRIPDLSVMVGQKLACRVSQIDKRGRGNIVLSRRDVLEEERKAKAEKLRESLHEGDVIEGAVRKIMPFGAFVDLGGVDGLVHLSDITYDRVNYGENSVSRYLKEGQQVTVKILKIDWDNDRISLGIKQLAADPFAQATNQITEGADVSGRVARLTDFGAFIEIAPGVDGLVHVSELAHRRVGHPADVLKQDEVVTARVLKIDPDSRKISLSIKALQPAPEPTGSTGGGRGGRKGEPKRSAEEIMKETPALRRLREKFGKTGFKGGIG